MKRTILFTLLSIFYVFTVTAQNTWLKTFGGDEVEAVNQIETDDAGNVYVAGRTNADLTIGDTVIKKDGSSSTSVYNFFLVKFNKAGDFVWANMLRVLSTDGVSGLAVDKEHNVYMSLRKPSYYYKFDSTGKQLFEKRINALSGVIGGIEIDDEGYTWLGCSFNKRPYKLDNLPTIDPDDKAMMFLAKLDQDGNGVMVVPFASNSVTSQISNIELRDSFIYAIGNTQFDIVVGTDTLKNCDILLAKFNTNGEYKWSKGITGTDPIGTEHVIDIAVSRNHQVVITGRYDDPIFVEGVTLSNQAERERMFLVSYDANGTFMWAKNSTSYNTSGVDIEFTPDNTLAYFSSYAFNFVYQGLGVGDGVSGKRYPILMETDTLGNPLWVNTLGQTNWTYGRAFSIDDNGNWYMGGEYTAEPNTTIDGKNLTALGDRDIYLIKNFTVPKPNVQSNTFCGGEIGKRIIAIGNNIHWYTDTGLTQLEYVGDTLKVNATATTTYYVVQKAGGAISEPRIITATILPATQVSIQATFPALTALPKTGKSYKWFADGVEVQGETSHSIIPAKSGKYHAVLIDSNDCNNYSDTVNYIFTSINELERNISVYPNPATNNVSISGLPHEAIKSVTLSTIAGKQLKATNRFNGTFSLEGIANGVYLVNVKTSNNQFIKKLVVQH